jgi:hypothetical protein
MVAGGRIRGLAAVPLHHVRAGGHSPDSREPLAIVAGAADGAQSCCFEAKDAVVDATTATSSGSSKRDCRVCSDGKALVLLLLLCRHLCWVFMPRVDVCSVCLVPNSTSIHVAAD